MVFIVYSSASWLLEKGRVIACSWARAANSLRNSQKMTAQYTAFFTRSASACFSRLEAPPPPTPLNRALCRDWPPSLTCARASWAACRALVGLLVCRRIRSPRDGLRLFTGTRKHYVYKLSRWWQEVVTWNEMKSSLDFGQGLSKMKKAGPWDYFV